MLKFFNKLSIFYYLVLRFIKFTLYLVPGDGGSQLEAKLNKTETVHYFCDKKSENYFSLWLNLELLVPLILDCWVDNMRLVYNYVFIFVLLTIFRNALCLQIISLLFKSWML